MTNEPNPTDKQLQVQKVVKYTGAVVVVAVVGAVVTVASTSVALIGGVCVGAIVMINYLPVVARYISLQKTRSMNQLIETFSEETIMQDEAEEGKKLERYEASYITSRTKLEAVMERLRKQIANPNVPESDKQAMQNQVKALQGIIDNALQTIKTRKITFKELQTSNETYISVSQAAQAMKEAQGIDRTNAEIKTVTLARDAIKNKMREALAGETIAKMNLEFKDQDNDSSLLSITTGSESKKD